MTVSDRRSSPGSLCAEDQLNQNQCCGKDSVGLDIHLGNTLELTGPATCKVEIKKSIKRKNDQNIKHVGGKTVSDP